jgi:hypothetical protein
VGLLTLLDSRTHRNEHLWKRILRLTMTIRRLVAHAIER